MTENDTSSNDTERNPPRTGGCWVCKTGNGYEDDDMVFDLAFDTYVHLSCLEEHNCETVLEYEKRNIGKDTE